MSKTMFEELWYPTLPPTLTTVQHVDSTIRHTEEIVESLLVKVGGSYIFMNFVVIDMQDDGDEKARINVGVWLIEFLIRKRT